jgi:hypothetical protein
VSALSLDTSREVERRQVEGWRRMSPADKAALRDGPSRGARHPAHHRRVPGERLRGRAAIHAIIKVQGAALDRDYLDDGARILGVSDLLERALTAE